MNNTKKHTITLFILLLFVLAAGTVFTRTAASAKDYKTKMKVRVGYFHFDGYHEIGENGSMSGYGYEFLQKIAPFANFEYEYIGYDKSWAEMQQMLENGEIDLLTSAHKTPERLKRFDFSSREIGFSATLLTALPSNHKLTTGDYSSFNGIRVGMTANNSRNESFFNYAKKYKFTYKTHYFDSQAEMAQALSEGDIDVMVTSDLRALGNEIVIDKFDEESFYAITKKGNSKLMERLDYAINMLNADSPNWITHLSNSYYNNYSSGGTLSLTDEEQKYIQHLHDTNARLKVLLRPERAPYSYFENDTPKGIFYEVLENISSQYHLPYEIIQTKNFSEYLDMIDKKVPDIVFDSTFDYYQAEQRGYHLTESYHTAQFCSLRRDDGPSEPKKFAVLSTLKKVNKSYASLYANCEILECPSTRECVQAVLDKKADATYLYTYTALKYVTEDDTGILIYAPAQKTSTNFSIAIKDGCAPVLYSIMNRIASNIGEDDIQAAISNNTIFATSTHPVINFIYHEPLTFTAIIVSIIATILVIVILKINRDKRNERMRRELEEQHAYAMKEAYDAANQANQAKSTFLSNVSHDIRTPMNVIIGMTVLASDNVDNPVKVSDCLSKIHISSKHLLSIINDVLDMSKIESGKLSLSSEQFNLQTIFDTLLYMIQPQAKEKQQKVTAKAEISEYANVIGDSVRLQQVLINIASNAVKYTGNGGKIDIELTSIPSGHSQYGNYRFVCRDNGIGMSKDYIEKIFEPFSRETRTDIGQIQGTGLGMSIAKSIITMMDGSIHVESEQNVGSVFTVTFKLKLQKNAVEKESASPNEETPGNVMDELRSADYSDKRILIVEDYDMNRMLLSDILSVTGIEIHEAENGKIAVDKFAASPNGFFDIIFMDIRMPEMNGYEATRAIRALDRQDAPTIPIIALTANAFSEDVEKAKEAGMNEHLAKGMQIDMIARVLKRWLTREP